MSRSQRFTVDSADELSGQKPSQLLRLFEARGARGLIRKGPHIATSLQDLVTEMTTLGVNVNDYMAKARSHAGSLPLECALALTIYTGDDVFSKLNAMLRRDAPLGPYTQLCRCMVKALALLPECGGRVYRGMRNITIDTVRQAQSNAAVWIWGAFTSTSTSREVAQQFGEYVFEIDARFARDISQFSIYPLEREVLLLPGTKMRVMDVQSQTCHLSPMRWGCGGFFFRGGMHPCRGRGGWMRGRGWFGRGHHAHHHQHHDHHHSQLEQQQTSPGAGDSSQPEQGARFGGMRGWFRMRTSDSDRMQERSAQR